MDNICFQRALRHIDHTGVGITDKMYWRSSAGSLVLSGGTQWQVLCACLVRRIVFIPDRVIQPDLQTMEQTVHTAQGD